MKKFYIRKTQQDALSEQNALLRRLLDQQEMAAMQAASRPVQVVAPAVPNIENTKSEDFDFDFDDGDVYFPKISDSSTQLKLSSTKVDLDMETVEKLKKKKSKSNKEKK